MLTMHKSLFVDCYKQTMRQRQQQNWAKTWSGNTNQ